MESKLIPVTRACFLYNSHKRCTHKLKHSLTLAVLTRPADNLTGLSIKPRLPKTFIHEKKTVKQGDKQDDWFDQIAINHLSQSLQVTTGFSNTKKGYEGLVEASAALYRNFNPLKQSQLVIEALERAFPRPILSLIRMMLPQSKLTREFFAVFTTMFFAWLVGPCEVRKSEMHGRREKNVVYMKKCRFLEETNCVGMCVNLCKMPCQTFIKDSLGMPVEMVPNFDEMSCEMIFGRDPPLSAHDPALKQPCYKLCNKLKHTKHTAAKSSAY